MIADQIAQSLGGKRTGKGWMVPSICHGGDGKNLFIGDGESGKLRATCYSHGCEYKDIMFALEDQGLKPKESFTPEQKQQFKVKQSRKDLLKLLWHELHVLLKFTDTRMCDLEKSNDANYLKQHPEFKPMPSQLWEREREALARLHALTGQLK